MKHAFVAFDGQQIVFFLMQMGSAVDSPFTLSKDRGGNTSTPQEDSHNDSQDDCKYDSQVAAIFHMIMQTTLIMRTTPFRQQIRHQH